MLLQKRANGPADRTAELERLQAMLEAAPTDASRAGLKKQIATIRAAHTREVRQREQAQREAQRLEHAQREEARRASAAEAQAGGAAAGPGGPPDAYYY